MDTSNQATFYPTEDVKKKMEEDKQKVAEHVSKHYRKYLFGIGVICGLAISIITRATFSASSESNAGYEPAPDINTIAIFNQMNALAHEKDEFLHQEGKIYSFSGENLFKKYNTMYHMLDNEYYRAVTIEEKIEIAKKIAQFFDMEKALFDAVSYPNLEKKQSFELLQKEFNETIKKIPTKTIAEIVDDTTDEKNEIQ